MLLQGWQVLQEIGAGSIGLVNDQAQSEVLNKKKEYQPKIRQRLSTDR